MGTLMKKTFETAGPVHLTVDLGIRSDIWVTATDAVEASVEIRPRNASRPLDARVVEQTSVEFLDGRLVVEIRQWRRFSWFSDGGAVEVAIMVPVGSDIDLSSGMGNVIADGEYAAASLRTGMGTVRVDQCHGLRAKTGQGDVTVGGATGHVEIATGTGKVRVGEIDGSATVKNSNGETLIGGVTRELRVSAANGDILIDRAAADVTVKASNGSIRIGEVARGAVTAATAAGSIDVGVRPGTAAWLDLNSKYGRVRNSLSSGEAPPSASAETVQIRARSSYGDVTVHRSER
jgi:DUF4097 and DUF4098 domain-containing protein YvlB